MYKYKARVLKVVDGDTLDVEIDMGLEVYKRERLRLAGIDAPERYKLGGSEATQWLTRQLFERDDKILEGVCYITTRTKGKYGRYLAWIFLEPDFGEFTKSLNTLMIEAGFAEHY